MGRDIPIESRDTLKDAMNCLPQNFSCVEEYRLMRNLIHEAKTAVESGVLTENLKQAVNIYNIMIQD